jgi:hypothetical protein
MWAYEAFAADASRRMGEMMVPLEVPAGHAVILDDAIVHASPPNLTADRRLAIQLVVVPAETPALWFRQTGTEGDGLAVEALDVDERYFFDFWHGDGDEAWASRRTTFSMARPTITPDHLAQLEPPPAAPGRAGVRGLLARLSRSR